MSRVTRLSLYRCGVGMTVRRVTCVWECGPAANHPQRYSSLITDNPVCIISHSCIWYTLVAGAVGPLPSSNILKVYHYTSLYSKIGSPT